MQDMQMQELIDSVMLAGKIIYENDLECEIETEYYPNLENLEAIGRIINIVGKNLSKINFDY